jgi:hypothetical protein
MATELIRDQAGGAVVIKFADLSDEELIKRILVFPEARREYVKRNLRRLKQRQLDSAPRNRI